jgi:hypothetical protein
MYHVVYASFRRKFAEAKAASVPGSVLHLTNSNGWEVRVYD